MGAAGRSESVFCGGGGRLRPVLLESGMHADATSRDGLEPDSTLTTAAPRVSEEEAAAIAAEYYGMSGVVSRVPGEKDDNFVVRTERGRSFLKVIHPSERAEVTAFCTDALVYLAEVSDLPLERVIPTQRGPLTITVETRGGAVRRVRMTTFLEGRQLKFVPGSAPLRRNVGRFMAWLGQALREFDHVGAERPLLWDLAQADRLRPLLDDLDDRLDVGPLRACLDRYDTDTAVRLARLRRQVIHNDFNSENVLVAEDGSSIAGVIDFGDMVTSQLINDVAVGAAYQLGGRGDPLGPALDLLRGYASVEPLTRSELELFVDLVRLRTVARVVISEWRAQRYPDNHDVLGRRVPDAWAHLNSLGVESDVGLTARVIAACEISEEMRW